MAISQIQSASLASGVPSSANMPTGSVLQVVNVAYGTQQSNTSSTYSDTGLTASITPKFSTSKILVLVSHSGCLSSGATNAIGNYRLFRNSTNIIQFGAIGNSALDTNGLFGVSTSYLDSPATTSATTYKTQFSNKYSSGTVYINAYDASSTITLMEIAG